MDGQTTKQQSPVRILIVGDATVPTGFARVIHSILDRLHSKYEFHHLGVNYRGDPHESPWKIYPANLNGDHFGVNRLGGLIEQIHPQLVFMMGDLWTLMKYASALQPFHGTVKSIAYFPVDSDPVEPQAMQPLLQNIDCLVTFTRFAEREVKIATERARIADPKLCLRPISVIPHGVDTRQFRPLSGQHGLGTLLENRKAARQRLFPSRPDLRDAFIVLNANRNQARKRIDVTMEAFAIFAKGKPKNVKLYLHMAREDSGFDIQLLAHRLNITDRLLVSTLDNRLPNESMDRLNLIYNACDVGLNTASAEGWGLVSFEHAATGAPQIVPRHTSLAELWDGAAELVDPSFTLTNERILTKAYYVAPADVAAALQRLYTDRPYYERLVQAAFRRATGQSYEWDFIAGQWDSLFAALLANQAGQDLPERIPSSNELTIISRKEHLNELALL